MDFFNGGIITLNVSLKSTKTHTLNIIKTKDIILELKKTKPSNTMKTVNVILNIVRTKDITLLKVKIWLAKYM